jgi:hypothetical protein
VNPQKHRDFLKELEILATVGLAAIVVGTAFGVARLITGAPISIDLPATPADHPFTTVNVEIAHPSAWQRVLFGLTQAPTAVLLIAVFALLVRTLHRARTIDPFTPQTIRNLRWMGLVLLLGLSTTFLEGWAQAALSATVRPERWGLTVQLPIAWLFGGLLCFAIAELVNRGRIMRDELASVI